MGLGSEWEVAGSRILWGLVYGVGWGSEWEVGHNYDVDDDDLGGLGSVCVCVCAHMHVGGG